MAEHFQVLPLSRDGEYGPAPHCGGQECEAHPETLRGEGKGVGVQIMKLYSYI
jgi:hypothetical protein